MEAAGSQPLFWHAFDLARGDETASILAAYSTLWMLGRHSRLSTPIDTVFIHGRPDLKLAIDHDAFHKRTGAQIVRTDSPDFDLPCAALGVALNNPLTDNHGPNLARELRAEVPIREIFPWGDLAFQGTLVVAVSLLLCGVMADVDTRFKNAAHAGSSLHLAQRPRPGKARCGEAIARGANSYSEGFPEDPYGLVQPDSDNRGRRSCNYDNYLAQR